MKTTFSSQLELLKQSAYLFDASNIDLKISILKSMKTLSWKLNSHVKEYHEILLFIASHAENEAIKQIVEQEFKRIAIYFKKNTVEAIQCKDSGFPYSRMVTRFTHDMIDYLNASSVCALSIEGYDKDAAQLNSALSLTLPALERDETSLGLENDELFDLLQVKPSEQLSFLVNEFSTLNHSPLVKDHIWESIKCWVNIDGKHESFSRSYNRIPVQNYFYQENILKKFNSNELIYSNLPPAKQLDDSALNQLSDVIKISLVLTMRETDPATYLDTSTLRLYELDRGISIAIYGMQAARQSPLQSYIGFTVFKNGFPAAYGGSWIFGTIAMFGLNIFEAFRGGESGFIMCQLLRVYHQAFGIEHFEVEPSQFGRDNPDGIKSGAYWFYYRYGFRSTDKKLAAIAEAEQVKIKGSKKYRTKASTLIHLTDSSIALKLAESHQISYPSVVSKITSMIRKEFKGNRVKAVKDCVHLFAQQSGQLYWHEGAAEHALQEIALMAHALKIHDTKKIELMMQLIHLKPIDPFQYNDVLKHVLS